MGRLRTTAILGALAAALTLWWVVVERPKLGNELYPGRIFLELMRDYKSKGRRPVGLLIDHGIGPWKASGEFQCTSGKEVAYISAEGDLYPCPGLIFEPFKVGNVFETPLSGPQLIFARTDQAGLNLMIGSGPLSGPYDLWHTRTDGPLQWTPILLPEISGVGVRLIEMLR